VVTPMASVSSSGGSYAELLAERLRRAQTGDGPPESPGSAGSSSREERTTLHESWLKKKRNGVFTSWQRRYFLLVLTRSDIGSPTGRSQRGNSHSRCSLEYYGACDPWTRSPANPSALAAGRRWGLRSGCGTWPRARCDRVVMRLGMARGGMGMGFASLAQPALSLPPQDSVRTRGLLRWYTATQDR
jgi:hypothetical protein